MASEQNNRSNLPELVAQFASESRDYNKQLLAWLAFGSGGAIVALLGLSVQTCQGRADALLFFAPSLWAYTLSIMLACVAFFSNGQAIGHKADHYASAHNREQLERHIRSMPEYFSAPRRLAEEKNLPRQKLIEDQNAEHEQAEKAWKYYVFWKNCVLIFSVCSVICFLVGMLLPLVRISFLEQYPICLQTP